MKAEVRLGIAQNERFNFLERKISVYFQVCLKCLFAQVDRVSAKGREGHKVMFKSRSQYEKLIPNPLGAIKWSSTLKQLFV